MIILKYFLLVNYYVKGIKYFCFKTNITEFDLCVFFYFRVEFIKFGEQKISVRNTH